MTTSDRPLQTGGRLARRFFVGGLAAGLSYVVALVAYDGFGEGEAVRWAVERMRDHGDIVVAPPHRIDWESVLSRMLAMPITPLLLLVAWAVLRSELRGGQAFGSSSDRRWAAGVLLISQPVSLVAGLTLTTALTLPLDGVGTASLICSVVGGLLLALAAARTLGYLWPLRGAAVTLGLAAVVGASPLLAAFVWPADHAASAKVAVMVAAVWPAAIGWAIGRAISQSLVVASATSGRPPATP